MTNEELLGNFDLVRKKINDSKDGGMRDGVSRFEEIYGKAYQRLVNAGLKPKLRFKLRPRS